MLNHPRGMWLLWLTDGTVVRLPEMTYSTELVTGYYDPLTRRQAVEPRTVRRSDPPGRGVSVQRRVTDVPICLHPNARGRRFWASMAGRKVRTLAWWRWILE